MEKSTFSILSTLQKNLTFENIEFLKEAFIKEIFKKYEEPINLNRELGILEYYDSNKNDLITINFENHLEELLWNETQSCKEAIDSTLILLNSIQKRKFITYIKTTLAYIEDSQVELILKFPICKKPLEVITAYLIDKYDIDFANNMITRNDESLFKVKSGITNSKIIKLYDITIKYEIIDDELISEETFVSALLDKETNEKIIFNCKSGLAIMYLHTISVWFDNLKAKSIENSSRFYTKAGKTPISETNYNKSKKSISQKDSETLAKFKIEFAILLD
jgi:hypothetical protein